MAVAVITGTTTGIGAALALRLAREGHRLVLVNRSVERTQPALNQIKQVAPEASVAVVEADLADPEAVHRAAGEIAQAVPHVGALFNNAGVLLGDLSFAPTGNEMHYQVNTVAPYLLTTLLRPQLEAAAAAGEGAGPNGRAVVVNTNSGAADLTGRLRPSDLRRPKRFSKLRGPYGQSKLALLALSQTLADDFAASGVLVRDVEPGPTKTVMTGGRGMPRLLVPIRNLFFGTPEAAADRLYEAGFGSSFGEATGVFVEGRGKVRSLPKSAVDPEVQSAVERLVKGDTTGEVLGSA